MKNNLLNQFGIGFVTKKNILESYGLKWNKNLNFIFDEKEEENNNIDKEKTIKLFNDLFLKIKKDLLLNLIKKEIIIKRKNDALIKKRKNGSYKGYKYALGYPLYNQRTRTNGKTSKKIK